jgi:hypothetical protein
MGTVGRNKLSQKQVVCMLRMLIKLLRDRILHLRTQLRCIRLQLI